MHSIYYKAIIFGIFIISGCNNSKLILQKIDFDQQTLIIQANTYLQEAPVTITSFPAERSAGGLHDYYSEGRYWWPNPDDPDGPYIRKDGYANPENFTKHSKAMQDLERWVTTLVAAYKITSDEKYARHALKHLNAWFVNAATKMNPSLLYGQAIKGIVSGRGIGIIDTVKLIEVALAIQKLRELGFLKGKELADLQQWFNSYATWLTTHQYGIDERDNGNNHSTWWAAQVAAYAKLADRQDLLALSQAQFKKMLPQQMAADGSFPEELARTKPYGYTIYNLEAWTTLAHLASTKQENLWAYESPVGSLRKAVDFFVPFMQDKSKWPYPPDVTGFESQPRQSDFLYFAAMAYHDEGYLKLWRNLMKTSETRAWILILY